EPDSKKPLMLRVVIVNPKSDPGVLPGAGVRARPFFMLGTRLKIGLEMDFQEKRKGSYFHLTP
ncbi:MAG: hypothetical protein KKF00_06135, partial [Proteobacteria bacterium]|nr:hypothetical protein [Pseudomonadota bacterium]